MTIKEAKKRAYMEKCPLFLFRKKFSLFIFDKGWKCGCIFLGKMV